MAKRGHSLLEEKLEGLMQEFLGIIKKTRSLRQEVEAQLGQAFQSFIIASADMRPEVTEEALAVTTKQIQLQVATKNVMSVQVPQFQYAESGDFLSYSLATTSSGLDTSLKTFSDALPKIVELAQTEHSARLLSAEIEKTRRRVNALEFVFVPEIERNVKYISSKLDEQERGALVSIMRLKEAMQ